MTSHRTHRPDRHIAARAIGGSTSRPRAATTPIVETRLTAVPSVHATSAIPVRAVLALVGTALALVLLFSFRTPDVAPLTAGGRGGAAALPSPTRPATAGGVGIGPTTSTGTGPATSAGPATASHAPTGRPSPDTTSGPTATTGTPGRTPRTSAEPTTAPATPAATAAAAQEVTGPVEQTPFGDVQVEVKVSGRQIVDVVALQLPFDRRRSAQISQYVEPILHQEALQAQSAQIDLISGATWTSRAYQASLEAALAEISG